MFDIEIQNENPGAATIGIFYLFWSGTQMWCLPNTIINSETVFQKWSTSIV